MEMRDEVLSTVGAQDMDTSGNQVSDLDDLEFSWENDQLDLDAVFKPGVDTPSFVSTSNSFGMGSVAENPNLIDDEQDKENSRPPFPTIPVSERAVQPPVLMTGRLFGTRNANFPVYV